MAKIQEGRAKGWEKWTFLWQVLSSGRRSACRGFPTLRHGCHQRLRVRVLKTDFSLFVDGDISILVILQVVHLCVQSRPRDWGEHSLAALWAFWGRPERQGEKAVFIIMNWPYLDQVIRDLQTNKCKGFGFVTMTNYEEALVAIQVPKHNLSLFDSSVFTILPFFLHKLNCFLFSVPERLHSWQ